MLTHSSAAQEPLNKCSEVSGKNTAPARGNAQQSTHMDLLINTRPTQEVLPLPPLLEAEFLQRHHPLMDFNLALKGAGSVTPTLGSQLIGCQFICTLVRCIPCPYSQLFPQPCRWSRCQRALLERLELCTQQRLGQQRAFGCRSGGYARLEQYLSEMQFSRIPAALDSFSSQLSKNNLCSVSATTEGFASVCVRAASAAGLACGFRSIPQDPASATGSVGTTRYRCSVLMRPRGMTSSCDNMI